METPKIGQLIAKGEPVGRDAVHIALAPVAAEEELEPGQRVSLVPGHPGLVRAVWPHIGIVDPFLTETVKRGERFYLFLFPGTVTSLRHVWTSPHFKTALPTPKKEDGS
jgi:hypothetical protein